MNIKRIFPLDTSSALLRGSSLAGVGQKANALSFQDVQIGNFMINGNYLDNTALFTVRYSGQPNSGLYGNEAIIDNVFFGGIRRGPPGAWTKTQTTNLDGTSNYNWTSTSSNNNIGNGGRTLDNGFYYASQNGNPIPANIGIEALSGTLNMTIYDSFIPYNGSIPAPNSLAVVPEPISVILFLTGAGVLAGRRYLKNRFPPSRE